MTTTIERTIEQQIDDLIALEDDCDPSVMMDAWIGGMSLASQRLEDAVSSYVEECICGRLESGCKERRQALRDLLTHPDMQPHIIKDVRDGLKWLQ